MSDSVGDSTSRARFTDEEFANCLAWLPSYFCRSLTGMEKAYLVERFQEKARDGGELDNLFEWMCGVVRNDLGWTMPEGTIEADLGYGSYDDDGDYDWGACYGASEDDEED